MSLVEKTQSKEQLFRDIRDIFVNEFEVDSDIVSIEARLYEDLDIDSIDAVDLMVSLKNHTGEKLNPETFKQVRTVGHVVDALYDLLNTR